MEKTNNKKSKNSGVKPIFLKNKFTLLDKFWFGFARFFKRKPVTIDLNELKGGKMDDKRVMICNHNGAGGPFSFRTFRKEYFMMWSAHKMTENYKSRREYLRETFYGQKLKYGKFSARFMSWFFGLLSPMFYSVAGVIPVYYDQRIRHTLKWSVKCIENDLPVVIFPENSSDGYHYIIKELYAGFLATSKLYYKQHGVDIPIYTCRYEKNPKKLIIGEPLYYNELSKSFTDEEIVNIFLNYMNNLKDCTKENAHEFLFDYVKEENQIEATEKKSVFDVLTNGAKETQPELI
ncbi:MAG: hypothetical protein FWC11_04090 [Firmicutes bacterium]|nr:hypothetical protein [Bacillota bacterium]MCL2256022.1 hypothetical protein [Bacillota bacterium]